jgi:diguanylate cyclase (GGDEF)-like protein/PAS domain S-box-containing protein
LITTDDVHAAKILIVDDQPVNVQLLDYLLVSTGYTQVRSTTDPRQVAGLHQEHGFDLIILDLHMPGMSGFEVMEALKPLETEAYLPVLVVTAEPDKKLAALEAGARDFVGKPFDPIEVLTRIRNMLEVRLLHRESRNYGQWLEQTVRERTAELQRFRSAMDATADAIFLVDSVSMTLLDVSEGACRLLGYGRHELLGADPVRLGLATRAQLEREALRSPSVLHGGPAPELVQAELIDRHQTSIPVEISWQLQAAGAARTLIAVARDIRDRLLAQEHLRHMANFDSLTGLPNRQLFFQNLRAALAQAQDRGARVVVLFIALDRFKFVNDSLGAALGDELLRQVSDRLMKCSQARDAVGRLGGDEFALLMSSTGEQADAAILAGEVREALRAPFDLHGQEAALTASIGIAIYPEDAQDPDSLLRSANSAMTRAKEAGRDGYRFFTAGMNVQVIERLDLELALRRALEQDEFLLYFQPKMNINTGRITGVEALLRWRRPGFGLVMPAEFVPVMEETGMIVRVGSWAIDAACRQIAAWSAGGAGDIRVAVNVSSRQFVEGDLEADIRAALARHQVDPGLLELELTESALMSNTEHTIEVLNHLKALGIRIAIDDFGTGYSSLAYLKRFPIDKLKIDIAFVRDVTTNPDDAAIALAIISMAHSLHMEVIAEGVESPAQLAYLGRHRCDEIQGFHFSRPLPADEVTAMVLANRALPNQSPDLERARETLLLVDDDLTVLDALYRLFRRDNYRILTAASPDEGFELLAMHRIQVIVCDQRMQAMSGTDFLGKVKEMYPDTIRIILSGETGLEAVLDAVNRGAIYRFYTKPWDDEQLRDSVRLAFHEYWVAHGPHQGRGSHASGANSVATKMVEAGHLKRQRGARGVDQAQSGRSVDGADPGDRRAGVGRRFEDGVPLSDGSGEA